MNNRPAPRRDVHLMNPEVLEAFEFAAQADAPEHAGAYLADWKHFLAWCKNRTCRRSRTLSSVLCGEAPV